MNRREEYMTTQEWIVINNSRQDQALAVEALVIIHLEMLFGVFSEEAKEVPLLEVVALKTYSRNLSSFFL